MASLISLKNGCLELLQSPLLTSDLLEGYADHLCVLAELKAIPRRVAHAFEKDSKAPWLDRLLVSSELPPISESAASAEDVRWFTQQTRGLIEKVKQAVTDYTPWLLPEYEPMLFSDPVIQLTERDEQIPLARLPDFIDRLRAKLEAAVRDAQSQALMENLLTQLPDARRRCLHLIAGLEHIASRFAKTSSAQWTSTFCWIAGVSCCRLDTMSKAEKVQSACYDLLASEARRLRNLRRGG